MDGETIPRVLHGVLPLAAALRFGADCLKHGTLSFNAGALPEDGNAGNVPCSGSTALPYSGPEPLRACVWSWLDPPPTVARGRAGW